jgi:PAS domain-containing protein
MQASDSPTQDFTTSFSSQRQRLLHHAAGLLGVDAVADARPEVLARLSQTLAAALEMLKVAEEELLEERRRNATNNAASERRLAHQQALFDRAPTALILTTADTTIRELNAAASRLLEIDGRHAEGRQLFAMTPREHQAAFREELGHAITAGGVAAWSFRLDRMRNVPVVVTACLDVIDDDPAIGARALYWNVRPLTP